MPSLPVVKREQLVRGLERAGFKLVREKSNHVLLRHQDGRVLTVAVAPKEVVGLGLLNKVMRDSGLTTEQFLNALQE